MNEPDAFKAARIVRARAGDEWGRKTLKIGDRCTVTICGGGTRTYRLAHFDDKMGMWSATGAWFHALHITKVNGKTLAADINV